MGHRAFDEAKMANDQAESGVGDIAIGLVMEAGRTARLTSRPSSAPASPLMPAEEHRFLRRAVHHHRGAGGGRELFAIGRASPKAIARPAISALTAQSGPTTIALTHADVMRPRYHDDEGGLDAWQSSPPRSHRACPDMPPGIRLLLPKAATPHAHLSASAGRALSTSTWPLHRSCLKIEVVQRKCSNGRGEVLPKHASKS